MEYAAVPAPVLERLEFAPAPYEIPALVSPWSEYVGIWLVLVLPDDTTLAEVEALVEAARDWLAEAEVLVDAESDWLAATAEVESDWLAEVEVLADAKVLAEVELLADADWLADVETD